MKYFEFKLERWQIEDFFKPIRKKSDILKILMDSIKIMLISNFHEKINEYPKMILNISKMARLIYCSEDKIYSISFPFTVDIQTSTKRLEFKTKDNLDVDNMVCSSVIAAITNDLFSTPNLYDFIEPLDETNETGEAVWPIFRDLLLFEDGYIRFDYDSEREKGKLHPLNHLDICYNGYSQFKIGLYKKINETEFLDLLDIQTDCRFIEK